MIVLPEQKIKLSFTLGGIYFELKYLLSALVRKLESSGPSIVSAIISALSSSIFGPEFANCSVTSRTLVSGFIRTFPWSTLRSLCLPTYLVRVSSSFVLTTTGILIPILKEKILDGFFEHWWPKAKVLKKVRTAEIGKIDS